MKTHPFVPIAVAIATLTAANAELIEIGAGKIAGIGSKARIVYDFDGDGKSDRTETFGLFALDPSESSWETYTSEKQALDPGLTRGDMQDFRNGSIRLEFWKCFGNGPVGLQLAESKLTLPDGSSRSLGETGTASTGDPNKSTGPAKSFYAKDHVLGVTLNGSHFGIFAPSGTKLEITGDTLISELSGKNYLSVAALPDNSPATIEWFAKHAYAFIRDTKITYAYHPETGSVRTDYHVKCQAMEGANTDTVLALYLHQHLHLTDPSRLKPFSYASPRGEMKVLAGDSFTTDIPYLGVLPALPNANIDSSQLERDAARSLSRKTTPTGTARNSARSASSSRSPNSSAKPKSATSASTGTAPKPRPSATTGSTTTEPFSPTATSTAVSAWSGVTAAATAPGGPRTRRKSTASTFFPSTAAPSTSGAMRDTSSRT